MAAQYVSFYTLPGIYLGRAALAEHMADMGSLVEYMGANSRAPFSYSTFPGSLFRAPDGAPDAQLTTARIDPQLKKLKYYPGTKGEEEEECTVNKSGAQGARDIPCCSIV